MPIPVPLNETLNRFALIIVTGGSSGIGCSIIKAINTVVPEAVICNLSRSEPDVFLGKKGVHLSTDLSDAKQVDAAAAELRRVIGDLPPGEVLLVNNSGFGDYGPTQEAEIDKQLNMIDLNVRAVVDLTLQILPEMQERGGVVMNIASTAAFQPTPYLAAYGATKAFVLNWSLALNEDLRGTKVSAMAICPGPTRSNFFKRAGFETPPMEAGGFNKYLDMTADEVAKCALRGLAKGKPLVVTGFLNKCIAFLGSKTPRVLVTSLGGKVLRKMRLGEG
ncbi:short-chain dehydrogenase [Coraliomargarita sinensis]|uniref:Short-chain dehydrogenase n=1 Tax=Coraliomargarita sinensis TaxID=2174842 RepID=A0A317ZF44_9BACT|nr:SDR family NAD(P)-dependent oxidoreductase [Coraliomargarita sinensis]PXA04174.1 short-chain dehydrogenase [Coraliomargarita sinensis]